MTNENAPVVLSCPTCNAPLDFDGVNPVIRCKFCGNTSVIPDTLLKSQTQISSDWKEVYQLIERGANDQALHLMESRLGVKAVDSKETLNAIRSGRKAASSEDSKKTSDEVYRIMMKVQELVEMGDKTEAVKLYMDTFNYDLERAENIISKIDDLIRHPGTPPKYEPPPIVPISAQKRSSAGLVVSIIFFTVLVPVIILLFAIFSKEHYIVLQNSVLLPRADGMTSVIAATFYKPSNEKDYFGVVDTASGKMLWKAELSNDDRSIIAGGSDLVFLANGSTLSSYQLSDGSLAWQNEMSDIPGYGETPMQVTSNRLMVYTVDHKITAFDTENGRQVWSRQLSSYHDDMIMMNDYLVLRDDQPDTYYEALFFLDPKTGKQQFSFSPVCEADGYSSNLDSTSAVIYDVTDNRIFTVLDAGCVMSFNTETFQSDWNTYQPEVITRLYSDYSSLLTGSTLYVGNQGVLTSINEKSGDIQELLAVENYDLVPLLESNGVLLVRAKRTLGSTRYELWGIDTESGEKLWQTELQNSEPIDPPDEMSGLVDDTDWGFTWHLMEDGLRLVTFMGEPGKVVLAKINLPDGMISDSLSLNIKGIGDEFYSVPKVIQWSGNLGYFSIDSGLYVLDLAEDKLNLIY